MNKKVDLALNSLALLQDKDKNLKQRGLNTHLENDPGEFKKLN